MNNTAELYSLAQSTVHNESAQALSEEFERESRRYSRQLTEEQEARLK